MLSVLKSKFINKKVSVFLISAFTLFIVFIGFVTIFFASDLMHLKLFGKYDLNQLSSTRLSIINNLMQPLTGIEKMIGTSSDIVDSLYLFFITFYGLIFSALIFIPICKRYRVLIKNEFLDLLIILCVILVIGLFEMPVSPFLPLGIIFFAVILYPKWIVNLLQNEN